MDYRRIEFLLEKYWQCETTLDEEEELRHSFLDEAELPAHLQQYRELFVLQMEEKQIGLTDDFDRKILAEIQQDRHLRMKRNVFRSVAAVVLLLLVGGTYLWNQNRNLSDPQTPEQALAEVQQALVFVSLKLNRGQQIIEENMEEVKIVTQYIKK